MPRTSAPGGSRRQSLPAAMAVSFLLLFAVRGCLSCSAHAVPRSRAKIVEEYVVSANFDENSDFPQLYDGSQPREIHRGAESKRRREQEGASPLASLAPLAPRGRHGDAGELQGPFDHRNALEERDYLVHHHHLPPVPAPPPPPPPPPPPAGLALAPSMFAVGFIGFLILLNSLQTSLLVLKTKGGLAPLSGVLGRRKRFAAHNFHDFPEKFKKFEDAFASGFE